MDQVEAKPPESLTSLELLSRMPGKAAGVQWVFVGRSEHWLRPDGPVAARLRDQPDTPGPFGAIRRGRMEAVPPPGKPGHELTLGRQAGGASPEAIGRSPGRFDAAVKAAIAAGLLQGNPARAA